MREIKFRAWDNSTGRMVMFGDDDFYYMSLDNRAIGCHNAGGDPDTEIEDAILMQYTGLKDKNGVEIYEGDIVSRVGGGLLGNPDKVLFTGEVVFTEHGYKAKYESDEPGTAGHLRDTSYGNLFNEGELEVIGNIYENPELLESES